MNKTRTVAAGVILALASQGAVAQFSLTLGPGYGGNADRIRLSAYPLTGGDGSGPWALKLNVPYNGIDGIADGGATTRILSQTRLSGVTGSGFYNVVPPSAGIGLDLGLKVRFHAPSQDRDPFAGGGSDYSIQADLYRGFGGLTAFGSLGWTKRGSIRARDDGDALASGDARNPWYALVGASYKLTDATSVGLAYDWRQRLFSNTRQISEATLFVTHTLTKSWKLQGFAVSGFSDASPDWGAGASVGYTW